MYGITTNYASTAALRNLQSINAQLDKTQTRIASGLRIASAKDGAAAWSAATTVRAEVSKYDAIRDGLGYFKAAADTASTAAQSIVDALNTIKQGVANYQATSDTDEQAAIMSSISGAQATIKAALAASKTDGKDWLSNAAAISFNVGVNSAGAFVTDGFTTAVDLDDTLTNVDATGGGSGKFITNFLAADITASASSLNTALDTAIGDATTIAVGLGAMAERIDSHSTFLKTISDIKNSALSSLVDANMEEESTKLSALQVQQSLATQALQISNASSQNILRLFQ
ncbi:flagellin [Consotaella salsifontis]|uniref:Flagellin n=1 Tax=Consotaella salsifontis TaxID=1365950 RepID=A0A1T4NS38_9HYPH|nr:flagellin [Consotaella salsifontis]SJZ81856.1 flagellin [Consotaella salsifontis]